MRRGHAGAVVITRAQVVQIEPPTEKWGERIGERRQKIMVPDHGMFTINTMFVISTSWLRSAGGWKVSTLILAADGRPGFTIRLPGVADHEVAITVLLEKINNKEGS